MVRKKVKAGGGELPPTAVWGQGVCLLPRLFLVLHPHSSPSVGASGYSSQLPFRPANFFLFYRHRSQTDSYTFR